MTGRQVLGALAVVAMATVVIPPAGAWWLNGRRISTTQTRVAEIAAAVRARAGDGQPFAGGVSVVCGAGRLPEGNPSIASPVHATWITSATIVPDAFGRGEVTDAWGRCLVFDAEAHRRGVIAWLLSAGPNGAIDTPRAASVLQGDDIGVVVR